jgi:hypothetical protein
MKNVIAYVKIITTTLSLQNASSRSELQLDEEEEEKT